MQSTIPSGSFSGSVEFWVTAPSAGVKHVTCLADSSGDCQETVVPAYLSNPQGLATDTAGNAYVADTGNDAIKVIPRNCLSANCVVTLGGNFNAPQGVAIDASGNLYVADTGNKAIEVLTVRPRIPRLWTSDNSRSTPRSMTRTRLPPSPSPST